MTPISISFVIPVYNDWDNIYRLATRLLNMDPCGMPFEALVVDDGSNSPVPLTLKNVISQSGGKIRLFSQINSGPLAARIKGIHEARYDYLLFLDADDDITDTFFATLSEKMTGKEDILFYNVWFGKEKFKPFENESPICGETAFEELCVTSRLGFSWCKIQRRVLFDASTPGLNERYKIAEDALLSIAFYRPNLQFRYIDDCLYEYIDVPGSITHSVDTNYLVSIQRLADKKLEALLGFDLFASQKMKQGFAEWFFNGIASVLSGVLSRGGKSRSCANSLSGIQKTSAYRCAVANLKNGKLSRSGKLFRFCLKFHCIWLYCLAHRLLGASK